MKYLTGIVLGIIAGIIDVIPMFIQDLPLNACLSAFTMWVIIGFFISVIDIKIYSIFKGIVISYLSILPLCFIIGWEDAKVLIPIIIMTTFLGGLLGFVFHKIFKQQSSINNYKERKNYK